MEKLYRVVCARLNRKTNIRRVNFRYFILLTERRDLALKKMGFINEMHLVECGTKLFKTPAFSQCKSGSSFLSHGGSGSRE
jgi:hypothetical protein